VRQVKAPRFLSDLHRDLRERHLLIPAVALVVALVALPVLLSAGSAPAPPPPSAAPVAAEDAVPVEPAVLAETTGIRDYRKRLAASKRKNPFTQQFAAPTKESVALQPPADVGTDGGSTGDVAASSPSSSLPPADTASTDVGATPGTGTPAPQTTTTQTTAPDTTSDPQSQQTTTVQDTALITRRIDVTAGPLGHAKRIADVGELSLLPSDKAPVVAFIGVSEDGNRAAFVVSADVTASDGDGRCLAATQSACQILTLKVGDQQTFAYAPDGLVYRLKVLAVHDVEVAAEKH
jgi:hypothetical protein